MLNKLEFRWVAHWSRSVGGLCVEGVCYFVVNFLAFLTDSAHAGTELAPDQAGLTIIVNRALIDMHVGLLKLAHLIAVFFVINFLFQSVRMIFARFKKIEIFKSVKLSKILQKSLERSEIGIKDNSFTEFFSTLSASQRALKNVNKAVRGAFVILGKENYIVIPLPVRIESQKMLLENARDAANNIAGLVNMRISSPKKEFFSAFTYLVFSLQK